MRFEIIETQRPCAETIVLSSGLGGAAGFWRPQLAALAERFRIVLYDHRGTGANAAALEEGHSVDAMADDVLSIVGELALERIHFVGHALGGLIGMQLALRRPELLESLVVVNAWSSPDAHTRRCFDARRLLLSAGGASAYVQAQPIFLYPAAWLSEHAEFIAVEEAHVLATFPDPSIVLKRIEAVLAFDIDDELHRIRARTLVVAARDDVLVPYTRSIRLASGLPNASLQLIDDGGHSLTVTRAASFTADLVHFLSST